MNWKWKMSGTIAVFVGAMGLLFAFSGCTVGFRAPSVEVSGPAIATSYYTPMYYNGYIVYYDNGRPIYYVNGVRYFVPRTYANYGRLTVHYRNNRGYYHRWYKSRGHRHRGYRRGARRRGRRGRAKPARRGTRRGPARRPARRPTKRGRRR